LKVNRKIHFYHWWDLKSVLITSTVILAVTLLILGITFFPEASVRYRLAKFDRETIGVIISIKTQEYIRQSKYSPGVTPHHYDVTYSYIVNEEKFIGSERIDANNFSRSKLTRLVAPKEKRVHVAYSQKDPSKSMINLFK
jgi:hypothetical protein